MATAQPVSTETASAALGWMQDPIDYFKTSTTLAHSVPREETEAIQLTALNKRLEQRREQIPVLAKLADGQQIDRLDKLEDVVPLLFEHTIYKSYPISLLSKSRYDQLTEWLNRLTPVDLSGVDVTGCDSIDDWLGRLQSSSELQMANSSGTTGTMSFLPRAKADYDICVRNFRMSALQTFGEPPRDADLNDKIHTVLPSFRRGNSTHGSFSQYYKKIFAKGDEAFHHTAYDQSISADLLWLAGRLRAAEASGDTSRIDVPANLLARRGEMEAMRNAMPQQLTSFIEDITKNLAGERIYATGLWNMFYDVAKRGLADGVSAVFAPDSVLVTGGGAKGLTIPDDWQDVLQAFFGIPRITMSYGMTELNAMNLMCDHHRYHVPPWLIVYVLDPDTSKPLPRSGVQTGRAAFFDLSIQGYWGGLISGDKVTVNWDMPCPCGRTSLAIEKDVERYSEAQGGNDKITCAATFEAHTDAMDYLNNLEG